MTEPPHVKPDSTVNLRRFFSSLLTVIGLTWLGFSGLCTGFFLLNWVQGVNTFIDLETIFIFAAPSVLIGLAVYGLGRWLKARSA